MIARDMIGVVSGDFWPRASIPCPVESYFWGKVARLPPEIEINVVGKGYHNAGWSYLEIECRAISVTKAEDVLNRLMEDVMCEFQLRGIDNA